MLYIKELLQKIRNKYVNLIDKIINTLVWLLTSPKDTIVLNVWIKHRGEKVRPYNFGDDINYIIASYLSQKKIVGYKCSFVSFFHPKNYMCIGSILDYMSNNESIVWGSGAIGFKTKIKKPPQKICAVRGPLTRNYLINQGIECPAIYGDPALLLPMIYPCKKNKRYKIGIIPHIIDLNIPSINLFKKNIGEDCIIVDLGRYQNWQQIVDIINECEIIASSSLHGLIVADAYKIPNVWIKLSENIIGNDFKYYDYFYGCGRTIVEPIDYIDKELDYNEIYKISRKWKSLNYNPNDLLRACPFLSSSFKL